LGPETEPCTQETGFHWNLTRWLLHLLLFFFLSVSNFGTLSVGRPCLSLVARLHQDTTEHPLKTDVGNQLAPISRIGDTDEENSDEETPSGYKL
jgi:hypothetical protein